MLQIEQDSAALAQATAELITRLVREAIEQQGRCTIALAGGSTPRAAYELLARPQYRDAVSWSAVHIFWGDERCVPHNHPNSNQRMARAAWLDAVPIPAGQIYGVPTELNDPHATAAAYERTIKQVFDVDSGRLPRFDLVLLGMGDDGHTASLFPDTPALQERERLVVANYVDKLRAWRITLTAPTINAAANVAFLISGTGKARVLRHVLSGPREPRRLPAQLIKPSHGQLFWLLDRAAAAELEPTSQR